MIAKIKKFLNGIEQAANLGNRCAMLEKENSDLASKNKELWDNYNKKESAVLSLVKEVADLKSKMREQSEADLVLISLKIIQRIMRGETKEQVGMYVAQQAQQMAAMQNSAFGQGSRYGQQLGHIGGIGQALF